MRVVAKLNPVKPVLKRCQEIEESLKMVKKGVENVRRSVLLGVEWEEDWGLMQRAAEILVDEMVKPEVE
jgi:hypothetical protein